VPRLAKKAKKFFSFSSSSSSVGIVSGTSADEDAVETEEKLFAEDEEDCAIFELDLAIREDLRRLIELLPSTFSVISTSGSVLFVLVLGFGVDRFFKTNGEGAGTGGFKANVPRLFLKMKNKTFIDISCIAMNVTQLTPFDPLQTPFVQILLLVRLGPMNLD
jgi:hypothetical protein